MATNWQGMCAAARVAAMQYALGCRRGRGVASPTPSEGVLKPAEAAGPGSDTVTQYFWALI
ncbi:hypothetical protein ANO14919_084300 [Xylariales sp. No.14919]|nr:hypothetical protein ANO14919_084300 [Xylariales sp. No.14919]